MGFGITVTCNNCGYNKDFMLGIGMMYCSLDNILNQLDIKTYEKIESILKENNVDDYKYSRVLTQCNKCNRLYEKSYLEISFSNGEVFKKQLICGRCRRELEIIKDLKVIKELQCPECKEKELTYIEDLLWD